MGNVSAAGSRSFYKYFDVFSGLNKDVFMHRRIQVGTAFLPCPLLSRYIFLEIRFFFTTLHNESAFASSDLSRVLLHCHSLYIYFS